MADGSRSRPGAVGRARLAAAALFGLIVFAVTATARANPRPLPFTYQSESLSEGTGEIEQFLDFVPLRALSSSTGNPVWYNTTQLQTEIEYGVSDKLEVALYFTFVPTAGDSVTNVPPLPEGNGSKQRARYRLAEPGVWPVDVAFYGEVAENEREIEIEAKIILQRRIGRLRLITNLWAEREFYFSGTREWVLNPTLGATYEVDARFHVGLEGWMRAEYPDDFSGARPFNLGPQVYVGPAVMLSSGSVWWTTGAYLRATHFDRAVQAPAPPAVGDAYGRFWIRTVVGLGF